MLLNGAAMAQHLPSTTGLLPHVVAAHELPATTALLATTRSGTMMMGAALAGILMAGVGVGMTLLIDALSFGLSAWLIASLKPAPQVVTVAARVWQDLRLGSVHSSSLALEYRCAVLFVDGWRSGGFGLLVKDVRELRRPLLGPKI